ncbi:hypothetical protein ACHAQE_000789 [Botrytis cinerea]
MSYSSYSSGSATWQEKLEERCREAQIRPPVFQIVSDRRGNVIPPPTQDRVSREPTLTLVTGGRTAWSSTVTVQGQNISARFWYDGQYVNNAKEDAAEVALNRLTGSSPTSPTQIRTGW